MFNKHASGSCGICNMGFLGTLEDHKKSKRHISTAKKLFCHACNVQCSYSDFYEHNDSVDHAKKANLRILEPLFYHENLDVKEALYQEIQKLTYNLYYSNLFPYEVAMKYLKKYNEEVSAMIRKNKELIKEKNGENEELEEDDNGNGDSDEENQENTLENNKIEKDTKKTIQTTEMIHKSSESEQYNINLHLQAVQEDKDTLRRDIKDNPSNIHRIPVLDGVELLLNTVKNKYCPLEDVLNKIKQWNANLEKVIKDNNLKNT